MTNITFRTDQLQCSEIMTSEVTTDNVILAYNTDNATHIPGLVIDKALSTSLHRLSSGVATEAGSNWESGHFYEKTPASLRSYNPRKAGLRD